MSFLERMGIIEPRNLILLDGMGDDLRTALFNRLYGFFDTTWEAHRHYRRSKRLAVTATQEHAILP